MLNTTGTSNNLTQRDIGFINFTQADPTFETREDCERWERKKIRLAENHRYFGLHGHAAKVERLIARVKAAHAHLLKRTG